MKSHSIKAQFVHYVSLSILGLLGISFYILVDTFFISQAAGNHGLAALNIAIPGFNLMQAIGLMIGIGAATKFTLSGDRKFFTYALYLAGGAALLLVVTGALWSDQLVGFLGADQVIAPLASVYLKTLLVFSPLFLLNNLLLAFVRNDGNPRLVMSAMIIASFFNIGLDYLLMFPLGMGIFGAALATGISPGISVLIMLGHLRQRSEIFRPNWLKLPWQAVQSISALGLSSFITEMSGGVVVLAFNLVIVRLAGNTGVAAYGIITNVAIIVMVLFTGLAQGMQPLLSREHRLGQPAHVREIYRLGQLSSVGIALVIYLLLFVLARPITAVFDSENNPVLAALAVEGIRLYFLAYLLAGLNITKAGYYSAIGKAGRGLTLALLRGLIVIVPVVLIMARLLGLRGVWLSLAVSDLLVFVVFVGIERVLTWRRQRRDRRLGA